MLCAGNPEGGNDTCGVSNLYFHTSDNVSAPYTFIFYNLTG